MNVARIFKASAKHLAHNFALRASPHYFPVRLQTQPGREIRTDVNLDGKNLVSGKRPAVPREGECSTPRTPALTGGERSLGRAASLRRALPLPPSEHTRLIRGPSADSSLTVGSWSARGLPQLTTRLDRLDAGNCVCFGGYGPDVASVGGDAFSFYLLRFQAGLVISGPHKASGLRAPQAERAPWGFLRLCGPGWLSSTSAGAGGFLGIGAAWVTVRPRATRPRVSFRRPGQCRAQWRCETRKPS